MNRMLYITVCMFLCCVAARGQAVRFTLDECLNYARGNSMEREQMLLSQRSAELDAAQAKLGRFPTVSASASENLNHTKGNQRTIGGSLGLSAGMTLFEGGAVNQTIKQSELRREQAEVRTAQYDNTLALDILSSYFSILGHEELGRYQQALVAAGREQVRDGRARLDAGAIVESDFLLFEVQLEQNLNNAMQTELDLVNELRNLKNLMSMPLDTELSLAGVDSAAVVLPAEADFVARAEASMPDLELLDYGVRIARSTLKIARAGYYPSLSLSGGVSTGHSGGQNIGTQLGDRLSQSAGVSLSVPLFNRGRVRTDVQKSRISLRQAELDREQGALNIRKTLLQSYSDAVSASNDYSTQVVRENAYRRSLAAYRARYAAGAIKPVDLLQQENNYINVMYQFVQSKYTLMLRRRMLDVYMGL